VEPREFEKRPWKDVERGKGKMNRSEEKQKVWPILHTQRVRNFLRSLTLDRKNRKKTPGERETDGRDRDEY